MATSLAERLKQQHQPQNEHSIMAEREPESLAKILLWGSNRRPSAYDDRRSTTALWQLLHAQFRRRPRHRFFSKSDISREGEREEEREREGERERERERAQRDRHARSTRRFLRSHYEITVCDRIASNCSVWDPPKFEFEVEVVSPFKGGA